MTGWDPAESGPSSDRVDALVWCLTELIGGPPPMNIDRDAIEQLRIDSVVMRNPNLFNQGVKTCET